MTRAAGIPRKLYLGNDSATVFPFPYKFVADDDLYVKHRDVNGVETELVLDVDYSVTGAGDATGGSITFPKGGSTYSTLGSGPPAEKLAIVLRDDISNDTDYSGNWLFSTVNDEGDKQAGVNQQLKEELNRAITFPITDPDSLTKELPIDTERANKNLIFDENGNVIVGGVITNTITSGAGAPTTTPNSKGDYYFDDTNDVAYLAFGTASSDDWKALSIDGTFGFVIDGAESAIVAGVKNYNAELTRAGIIYRITTISMVNGVETAKSIKADILMNGVSISASDPLFLDAATEENKTSFTGWTLPFNKHDKPQIEVLSSPVPDAEYITVTVHYKTSSDI
jgi:hypothetical protein